MTGVFTLERKPLGYRQLTVGATVVDLADATGGIPAGAKRAVCVVDADDIRWRDDAVAPTSSVGMLAADGAASDTFELPSLESINGFRAIRVSTDATLNILYYGV